MICYDDCVTGMGRKSEVSFDRQNLEKETHILCKIFVDFRFRYGKSATWYSRNKTHSKSFYNVVGRSHQPYFHHVY